MSKFQFKIHSREEKQALCQAEVLLNGERAKVCGYDRKFAIVRAVKSGEGYEWSWSAVEHIVANKGGEFVS